MPQMHVGVVRFGFLRHTKVLNGVMDGYVKCGIVGEARRVFEEIEGLVLCLGLWCWKVS